MHLIAPAIFVLARFHAELTYDDRNHASQEIPVSNYCHFHVTTGEGNQPSTPAKSISIIFINIYIYQEY
jgi:hypothetical protein